MGQGKQYDLVVRVRPDLPLAFRGFGWRDILNRCQSEPILFADTASNVHYMNLMMGDQLAISSPQAMDIYANTWKTYPPLAENNLFRCTPHFEGHLSLAMVCWTHNLAVEKIPLKKGDLLDPEPLSTENILAALTKDSTNRNSSWDKRLIEAAELDARNHA